MAKKNSRYKKLESIITIVLCINAVLFLAYLVFAGMGMITLKIITAIIGALISGLILYYLYMTKELLRKRSIWMTLAAACIIICILFSLVLNFPAPRFTLPVA